MSQLLIDEAWTKSDPAKLKADGYVGIIGYISHDVGKSLHAVDIAAAHAHGLGVLLVFEDVNTRPRGGYAAGLADGVFANAQATALGLPADRPLYYAVDFAVGALELPTILLYLQGAAQGGRSARAYGDDILIDYLAAHGIPNGWQTSAWSGRTVSSHAVLYQHVGHTLPTVPGSYDEDMLLGDAGMWMPAAVPAPVPPVPVFPHPPFPGVIKLTKPFMHSPSVLAWQQEMMRHGISVQADGVYGPASAAACAKFQHTHGLTADSIVGPKTWAASWA